MQRGHDPLKFYESPGDGRYLRLALRAGFWGIGAVGSALPWHGRGQGFESPMLHPTHKARTLGFDSGLVAVLGPGEGVGVDLRVGVHFEGSVVFKRGVGRLRRCDLGEEGLVAKASVDVSQRS